MKKLLFLLAFSIPLARPVQTNAAPIQINFPAPNMDRAVKSFMLEFESRYAHQEDPVPIATVLFKASVLPINASDARLLETTADHHARLLRFENHGSKIISVGNEAKGVTFPILLNGQSSTIGIDFPIQLQIEISFKSGNDPHQGIVFAFSPSLPLYPHNINLGLPLPLPNTLFLESISVSDSGISYSFNDKSNEYLLNLKITNQS